MEDFSAGFRLVAKKSIRSDPQYHSIKALAPDIETHLTAAAMAREFTVCECLMSDSVFFFLVLRGRRSAIIISMPPCV
jgi:hypothetical protein